MKNKNPLFKMDDETKEILAEVSATFGVKNSIVVEVWQYTIFALLLHITENKAPLAKLKIPYIGSIGIRDNGSTVNSKGVSEPDIETFLCISDEFKELYGKVRNGNFSALSDYIKDVYLKNVLENINNEPTEQN